MLAQFDRSETRIAALYASNTFGAVLGVLATAFWLVPELGLTRSAGVCAALNVLCALAAFEHERRPIVALCPEGRVYEKMLSNVQEVKARGGPMIAVVSAGDAQMRSMLDEKDDAILEVPRVTEVFSPFLTVLPLQLLAYHVAVRAGRDVDQPRNLAKSVTVE